jgi:phosphatidylserine/phosphatidylglycerophosphate/cardiolipin synthase-like enzyme
MDATHPWFLTGAERGNPASALARDPAWTEGNAVSPLIHGRAYFSRLAEVLGPLGPGDHVYLTDWRGDDDQRLDDDGPTLAGLLVDLARRGVEVRGLLWRSHPRAIGFNEEEETELAGIVNAAGGQLLLDERVRRAGSHHQKLVVAHHPGRPDEDVAFVGGIDLCHGRRDDVHHLGDLQAQHLDRRYGERAPWHDVQAQVRGPAVGDLAETFRERWNDRTPLEHRSSPFGRIRVRAVHEPTVPDPIAPPGSSDARPGSHQVQVLRTYPCKRPRSPFAPDGERSIARFYRKAIARARSLLYIEDQYFWSREVGEALAEALRSAPELRVIVVVPRFPDRDGAVTGPAHRVGQDDTLDLVLRSGGDRVAVYDLENETSTPIYVHAKVVVVDDEVALIGSDNMNRRSWTHDSELSIAVVDRELDDRAPRDPGGHGEGARRFARDLRLTLTREHLGVSSDDHLVDPVEAFERWLAAAASLDAWHASGRSGPRPPGRVRRHEARAVPTWQRVYATPLYRLVVDPDGRSFWMRRRHTF